MHVSKCAQVHSSLIQSSNRINVALSRAKHGLYIMGNASNLRKNPTWSTIIDELEDRDQIGTAFPIICVRHPDQAQLVSKPGELSRFAPAGGCLLPCAAKMPCGHVCPSVVRYSVILSVILDTEVHLSATIPETIIKVHSAPCHAVELLAPGSTRAIVNVPKTAVTAGSRCTKYDFHVVT